MKRTITVAASVIAVLAPVKAEAGQHRSHGCNTRACEKRVCKRAACKARVSLRSVSGMKQRVVAPYAAWLRKVRMCESGSSGLYRANTGNGFYGAYQFTASSWRAVGGWGMPHLAAPLEQDYRAVRLLHAQGRGAWPVCG